MVGWLVQIHECAQVCALPLCFTPRAGLTADHFRDEAARNLAILRQCFPREGDDDGDRVDLLADIGAALVGSPARRAKPELRRRVFAALGPVSHEVLKATRQRLQQLEEDSEALRHLIASAVSAINDGQIEVALGLLADADADAVWNRARATVDEHVQRVIFAAGGGGERIDLPIIFHRFTSLDAWEASRASAMDRLGRELFYMLAPADVGPMLDAIDAAVGGTVGPDPAPDAPTIRTRVAEAAQRGEALALGRLAGVMLVAALPAAADQVAGSYFVNAPGSAEGRE